MSEIGRVLIEALELDLDRCSLTFGVLPCTASGAAGTECYNTFVSCQDKPNYARSSVTHVFISRGAPLPTGQLARPYVSRIDTSPTLVDPENGIARRALVTVSLLDETDSDVGMDPYLATRTPPEGSFFGRFLARNPNYVGRPARIKRGLFTPDAAGNVSYDLSAPEFVIEHYLIDSVKSDGRGAYVITLKDRLKFAERIKVPTPTKGKLAFVLGVNDLQLTLDVGQGLEYPASGYVRNGDEVIHYTSNVADVLSWPDGTYRAQFGTSAAEGKAGDGIQLCQVWIDERFNTVVHDLLNLSDITDANIDLAQLVAEDDTWLGEKYRITTCLTDPEDVSTLLAELCKQSGGVLYVSPTENKIKYKVIGPKSPSETALRLLTDEANAIEGKTALSILDNLRLNLAGIYFGLRSATVNKREAKNYALPPEIAIDVDARSANEYGDRRDEVEYSRWFGGNNVSAMRSLVSRRVLRRRDAPKELTISCDPKDADIIEADLLDIETRHLQGVDGTPQRVRVLVTKKDHQGNKVLLTLRTTTFGNRYAFIAPNGQPNYGTASEAERAYAYICNSSGKMSNGDNGYLII